MANPVFKSYDGFEQKLVLAINSSSASVLLDDTSKISKAPFKFTCTNSSANGTIISCSDVAGLVTKGLLVDDFIWNATDNSVSIVREINSGSNTITVFQPSGGTRNNFISGDVLCVNPILLFLEKRNNAGQTTDFEKVIVSGKIGDNLSIEKRGFDGTTAKSFVSGDYASIVTSAVQENSILWQVAEARKQVALFDSRITAVEEQVGDISGSILGDLGANADGSYNEIKLTDEINKITAPDANLITFTSSAGALSNNTLHARFSRRNRAGQFTEYVEKTIEASTFANKQYVFDFGQNFISDYNVTLATNSTISDIVQGTANTKATLRIAGVPFTANTNAVTTLTTGSAIASIVQGTASAPATLTVGGVAFTADAIDKGMNGWVAEFSFDNKVTWKQIPVQTTKTYTLSAVPTTTATLTTTNNTTNTAKIRVEKQTDGTNRYFAQKGDGTESIMEIRTLRGAGCFTSSAIVGNGTNQSILRTAVNDFEVLRLVKMTIIGASSISITVNGIAQTNTNWSSNGDLFQNIWIKKGDIINISLFNTSFYCIFDFFNYV